MKITFAKDGAAVITTTFQFRQYTFLVKLIDGYCAYRDEKHLGGPWSDAQKAVDNTYLDVSFRRGLRKACDQLKSATVAGTCTESP